MAALVSLNELRAGPKFELKQPLQLVASDGMCALEHIHVVCDL